MSAHSPIPPAPFCKGIQVQTELITNKTLQDIKTTHLSSNNSKLEFWDQIISWINYDKLKTIGRKGQVKRANKCRDSIYHLYLSCASFDDFAIFWRRKFGQLIGRSEKQFAPKSSYKYFWSKLILSPDVIWDQVGEDRTSWPAPMFFSQRVVPPSRNNARISNHTFFLSRKTSYLESLMYVHSYSLYSK